MATCQECLEERVRWKVGPTRCLPFYLQASVRLININLRMPSYHCVDVILTLPFRTKEWSKGPLMKKLKKWRRKSFKIPLWIICREEISSHSPVVSCIVNGQWPTSPCPISMCILCSHLDKAPPHPLMPCAFAFAADSYASPTFPSLWSVFSLQPLWMTQMALLCSLII